MRSNDVSSFVNEKPICKKSYAFGMEVGVNMILGWIRKFPDITIEELGTMIQGAILTIENEKDAL